MNAETGCCYWPQPRCHQRFYVCCSVTKLARRLKLIWLFRKVDDFVGVLVFLDRRKRNEIAASALDGPVFLQRLMFHSAAIIPPMTISEGCWFCVKKRANLGTVTSVTNSCISRTCAMLTWPIHKCKLADSGLNS
jgi:hypothetical protein